MVYGRVLQITFNRLQETIGNLTLERPRASKATLEMADVCSLEPGVGQEGYGRENTKALGKSMNRLHSIGHG